MNLQVEEVPERKRAVVTFEYEGDESTNDIANMAPAKVQATRFRAQAQAQAQAGLPNVGGFKTHSKPVRINAPIDPSIASGPVKAPSAASVTVKKKQISYDDILSSMNMKVGPDGKLQMFSQKLLDRQIEQQEQQYQGRRPNYQQQNQHQPEPQQTGPYEKTPPLTEAEHRRLVIMDALARQAQIERIRQIKSTKLLFSNPHVNIRPRQPTVLNRFFRLK
jgi:hypothetical protein